MYLLFLAGLISDPFVEGTRAIAGPAGKNLLYDDCPRELVFRPDCLAATYAGHGTKALQMFRAGGDLSLPTAAVHLHHWEYSTV